MNSVKDKNVLITGGTRGIGAAISSLFADQGAKVSMIYKADLESARTQLQSLAGKGHELYQCDICNPKAISQLYRQYSQAHDTLDILINNAGIAYHHPVDKTTYEEWQSSWSHIISTNLLAPSNMSYHAAHIMKAQGHGCIINISSRGAFKGEPMMPAYGASKAALNSMTQSLAFQLAPYNIRVGAIAPGFVETEMSRPRLEGKIGTNIKNQSPLTRVAQPQEVAEAAYLMAKSNIWMTGSVWDVNGASHFR
ncbi:MAG: 3-oxoacyl-[acyl-carrier protein] reductase [Saprospiraceae bacterium]|jgi:3-oxoacyl-[acyl-carrier protein] reductase